MSVKSMLLAGMSALLLTACQPQEDPQIVETPRTSAGGRGASGMDERGHGGCRRCPGAVEAGLEVLRNGGHAVDAAIAVHTVLGLVEPQSSGIGGGAFMVVYDRATGDTTVFDGRETAPSAIDENLFIEDGEVLGFIRCMAIRQVSRRAGRDRAL